MKFKSALFQIVMVVSFHHDHVTAFEHQDTSKDPFSILSSSSLDHHPHAMMPNPNPYQVTYDDGTKSPLIRVRVRKGKGKTPFVHLFEETTDGFTLNYAEDGSGKYTYLDVDEESGELIDTGLVAGIDDPISSHIHKDALKISEKIMEKKSPTTSPTVVDDSALRKLRGSVHGSAMSSNTSTGLRGSVHLGKSDKIHENAVGRRTAIISGTLKNLVIPFKFADHASRTVPSSSDLNILMNNEGPHYLCPTGSVRDVYLQNSFNKLDLESTVLDWVTIDYTEAYCSGGNSALSGTTIHTCLVDALDKVVAVTGIDFADFDTDQNGIIDGITFFHSGYAAEWGQTDWYGQSYLNRIWSHKWQIHSQVWKNNGIRVYEYHINPALWGTYGTSIGRIGVIAHETGHFLGLPDLYDYGDVTYGDGNGVGAYGLMGDNWGFDGSQYYPPNMSAWSKYVLGWVSPVIVSDSGSYSLGQACDNDEMVKIDAGYPSGEYLLIENRQPCGFEGTMPQGGLAIFHVDEKANDIRGFPEQYGWPTNGNHYKVSILQADGYYGLEMGLNTGDATDLFRAGYVSSIGPDGTSLGPYPNTKAYQNGDIIDTEVSIVNIGSAGATMTFDIIIGEEPTSYLDGFDFYPYVDSGGNDIGHQGGGIEVVAEKCATDPSCKGFNSNGWMKHTLLDQSKWSTWTNDATKGFYVKKGSIIVPTPAPTPVPSQSSKSYLGDFDFHPYMDSGGNDIGHQGGGVEVVAEKCALDPNCRGFNSNGWMKHTLRDESMWTQWTNDASKGFYVKKDMDPETNYLEEFDFYPHMDSFGNDIGVFSGSLSFLAKECYTNPSCEGFNSAGWLKHTILDQSEWFYWNSNPENGIYVKK